MTREDAVRVVDTQKNIPAGRSITEEKGGRQVDALSARRVVDVTGFLGVTLPPARQAERNLRSLNMDEFSGQPPPLLTQAYVRSSHLPKAENCLRNYFLRGGVPRVF